MAADQMAMYVDGAWCAAESGETFDAVNPATGEVFAAIPKGSRTDAQRAIAAARAGQAVWAKLSLSSNPKPTRSGSSTTRRSACWRASSRAIWAGGSGLPSRFGPDGSISTKARTTGSHTSRSAAAPALTVASVASAAASRWSA
jgi:Aldehyde dehydrogenase family